MTDLAKLIHDNSGQVINNWVKSVSALEYLHAWESLHNPAYNAEAYREIRMRAGSYSFYLSAGQWIEKIGAVGLQSSRGRGGGTFAHHLIALEFCTTLSAEFRLNVFKEYLESKSNQNTKWLKTNEFYLRKMEDCALEINNFAREMQKSLHGSEEE